MKYCALYYTLTTVFFSRFDPFKLFIFQKYLLYDLVSRRETFVGHVGNQLIRDFLE